MAKTFREGMQLPKNDDMTPSSRKKPASKVAPKTKLPPLKKGEYDAPGEPDMGSIGMKCGGKVKKYASGGMVSEYGGREKYPNKSMQRQHERAESPAKEKAEKKGSVRGGGAALRGVGKGRMR